LYAVGAFNWRVKIGDTNFIVDYKNGQDILTSEQNQHEINWSYATPISGFWCDSYLAKTTCKGRGSTV